MEFIPKHQIPISKKVTYANMVCDYRPLKAETYRVRLTVGEDRLDYHSDAASPAASLLETKLLINTLISQLAKGCRFMTIDIKDFFLQINIKDDEYMQIHSKYFMPEICKKYNIDKILAQDQHVYCKINKGMYGLKQAAQQTYDDLKTHLKEYGYEPDLFAQYIWKYNTQQTKFCLCVDDFGVQFFNKNDAEHLKGKI